MFQETLQLLDLSPNEAKIYETLVEKGESSVGQIAVAAKVHRRNVYDSIQRLIEKGLCFEIFSKGENTYSAVDPDKLLELVAEKQNKLLQILPQLKKKFQHNSLPEEAYIYRGVEGQKNVWRDVLRIGKDNYIIGAKGGWFDPKLTDSRNQFFKEANRKGIKFYQLYDSSIRQTKFPKEFSGKLEYRYLPKEQSTNSLIHIFGDYVVMYTGLSVGHMNEDTIFFIIHSKDLAESYRTWFKFLWEKSEKGNT